MSMNANRCFIAWTVGRVYNLVLPAVFAEL